MAKYTKKDGIESAVATYAATATKATIIGGKSVVSFVSNVVKGVKQGVSGSDTSVIATVSEVSLTLDQRVKKGYENTKTYTAVCRSNYRKSTVNDILLSRIVRDDARSISETLDAVLNLDEYESEVQAQIIADYEEIMKGEKK